MAASPAHAQRKLTCGDGERYEIDVRQIAIRYEAGALLMTLSGLSVLRGRISVEPKTLQTAAAATQEWNEYLKGLAVGYNSCAITKQQYDEGLKRLVPGLKADGAELEKLRQQVAARQKVDEGRLAKLLEGYEANLRAFAKLASRDLEYDRIAAVVAQELRPIAAKQDLLGAEMTEILQRVQRLERQQAEAPIAKPAEVRGELRRALAAKSEEAEAAYSEGYALYERFRFAEAIPRLERALAAVKLPQFYIALGAAYRDLPDLEKAEQVLREGLALVEGGKDEKSEAELAGGLATTLLARGYPDEALRYAQRALAIDEKVHGHDTPEVAADANAIGAILYEKGELDEAVRYARRALAINEKAYGSDHPKVASNVSNLGAMLYRNRKLDEALRYTQQALAIDEKAHGPEHPKVAIRANNIGAMLYEKEEVDEALRYVRRALAIDEKVYGLEHPVVAIRASNLGAMLYKKGELDEALRHTRRALAIDEKVYGPEHPMVATRAGNIGFILKAMGDLDGALRYTQRALAIDVKTYGPDHPDVSIWANNIGAILEVKGDLDGALRYTQQALAIDRKKFGSEHSRTKDVAGNLARIQKAKASQQQ